MLTKHLMCARHYTKCFTYIYSQSSQWSYDNVIINPIFTDENTEFSKLSNLSYTTPASGWWIGASNSGSCDSRFPVLTLPYTLYYLLFPHKMRGAS